MYHVKSLKKNGTYFGRFKSLEDAQEAADKAIMDDKYGADDWEPEEKGVTASGDEYGVDIKTRQQIETLLRAALNAVQNELMRAARGHTEKALDLIKKVIV